ncbi:class I SAM-dependent methyltransferase [Sphaerisporangium sp. NBC_01403]|uniref:class I SAM-dependent methyltransferase n=1 Tax=Sphaerisporangium sp. NBC_01403 TaxID=2903599 RepID=UPI0032451CA5
MSAETSRGTGPGVITPDGSPVEFYALLEAGDEPEIIRAVVPESGSILELGSGSGRVTHPLVGLGYHVVAVDESPEMLARVHGAETVCSSIQDLRLDRRFDAVLLASYFVNLPDDALRGELLAACRRHVRDDGSVLIQWQPPEAHDAWRVGGGRTFEGGSITLAELSRPAPDVFSGTTRYELDGKVWTQSFTSRRMTNEELAAELASAGLAFAEFLTGDHAWIRATPRTP